ncbi:hypothetical protein, partial [Schnuerera sp.]|uniref:hypothetical protein n=1 Tax=Schnuerera sp. TaxID=2794844 RepID=UPI002C8E7810
IEISFIILDDEIIEYSNINNFPIFHGSTLVDNIRWLNGLGDIYYFQRENPFDKEDDNCDY